MHRSRTNLDAGGTPAPPGGGGACRGAAGPRPVARRRGPALGRTSRPGSIPLPVVALLLLAGAARADFDPEAWGYFRTIKVAEGQAGKDARVRLDDHVWDHAAGPALQDLRVIRGEADDIGYVVHAPEKETTRTEEHPARVFNTAKRGTEASELSVDLGADPPMVNRIRLETPDRNFRCAVTVEASDDGKTWNTVRADGAIFAFTGDVEKRFTKISFPPTKKRYLRVVVAAPAGGKPIDLTGAAVLAETEPAAPELALLVERPVASRTDADRGRETWHTLDLGARHLPVSKVRLAVAAPNFARAVRIDVGDDPKSLGLAGQGYVFSYRTDRYDERQLEVEFGEAFGRYLRVRVTNGDDPPLEVSRLTVFGRPRYVFFPFEQGQRYRLFYGNPEARPPQYEYANVFRRINRAAAIEARLDAPERNPRFIATKAAQPPSPWLVSNQWVLYVGLGLAVAALALVAVRALRKPAGDDQASAE
jgi:hypothetical protein